MKKILVILVAAFVLFDFILHISQSFGHYLYRFPNLMAYNLFWTIGWGIAFILLMVVLGLMWKRR